MTILVKELPEKAAPGVAIEIVTMTWSERQKPHRKCVTDKGTEIALALGRGTTLADGTVLYCDGTKAILVKAEREALIVIRPVDQRQACIAAHQIGNWHHSLQVTADGELLAEKDGPLAERLSKLGIDFVIEDRIFQPNVSGSAHD